MHLSLASHTCLLLLPYSPLSLTSGTLACVHVCERERKSVCVCERQREEECVCVCERQREEECVFVCVREREEECVCERERVYYAT